TRELRPRSNAELCVCPRQRLLDGIHRDEQLSCDLAIRLSGEDEVRNAPLARRQLAGGGSAAAEALELRACPLRPQRCWDAVEDSERPLERLPCRPPPLRAAVDEAEDQQRPPPLQRLRRRRELHGALRVPEGFVELTVCRRRERSRSSDRGR